MNNPLTRELAVTDRVGEIPWDDLDPDIRPFVCQLNHLPGVQTHQSCAGHGDDEYVDRCGGVWITLFEPYVRDVIPALEPLSRSDLIEEVSLTWGRTQPAFSPVLRIRFKGNERDRLQESTRFIVDTLRIAIVGNESPEEG